MQIGIYEDRRLAGFINDMFYYAQDSTHIGFEYEGVLVANIDENGNFSTTSDKRLKKNIKSLPPVIEKIMKLTPSNYEMKNSSNKTHIGFIAQNINDNFPELVNHYYNGEYDQHFVNYDGMIPVLTKAIQEQQNTIDLLVDKIEKLEKLIDQEP